MKWLLALLIAQLAINLAAASELKVKTESPVGIVNRTEQKIVTVSFEGLKAGDDYVVKGCCAPVLWYILGPSYISDGVPYVCCTSLPAKWQADMKVLVRWKPNYGNRQSNMPYMEKIVPVENYDFPSNVYIHFFPNDEVRVVVSRFPPLHPEHPIPPPEGE